MKDSERGATPCPWCGAAVPLSLKSFPWIGEEGAFLRCGCGAIGLATIKPEADRFHVAEEVLGMSRRLWVDQAWGGGKRRVAGH